MSFILDALKKSEADRQRQAGPALLEMRVVPVQRRLPLWAIVVGVLLLVNVVVLGWFALHRASADAGNSAGLIAATPGGAPAAAPALAPGAAPGAVPGAPTAAGTGNVPGALLGTPALPEAASGNAPPWMAQQANTAAAQSDFPEREVAPPAAEPDNPADHAPAVNDTTGTARSTRGAGLQNYVELSGKLPELRLDLHVYAARPADRYAFINMHKLREGDVTPEGVRVVEITADGAVLDYRGTEFLLGHQ
jgi:general secretion pathway protein B